LVIFTRFFAKWLACESIRGEVGIYGFAVSPHNGGRSLQLEPEATGATRTTRLQRIIDALRLKPLSIVNEAGRLAAMLQRPSISRQHFARIRSGRANASEEKIFIIVAAMRSVTGLLFRSGDLFEVEPQIGEGGVRSLPASLLWMMGRLMDTSNEWVPISSVDRVSSVGRHFVVHEPGSTGEAFESLYSKYGLLLRTIAMRRYHVPPDDAEALVHDVFAAYLERRAHVREAKGWLTGAIKNASLNYLRKRRPESPLLSEHEETPDQAADEHFEQWLRRSTIASVFARLGTRCRETLRSYYLREESKERIAAQLDTSPGNVLQLLVTCRRRAQELVRRLTGMDK
jgi:RNA polymerase sigma factor (sigma-70 family)